MSSSSSSAYGEESGNNNEYQSLKDAFRICASVLFGIIVLFAGRMIILVTLEKLRYYDSSYRKECLRRIFIWMGSASQSHVTDTSDTNRDNNSPSYTRNESAYNSTNQNASVLRSTRNEDSTIHVSLPLQTERKRYEDFYNDFLGEILPGSPFNSKNMNQIKFLTRRKLTEKMDQDTCLEDPFSCTSTDTSSSDGSRSLDCRRTHNTLETNSFTEPPSITRRNTDLYAQCSKICDRGTDVESQRNSDHNNIPEGNEIVCSICMNEMIHGESIYIVESCHHAFHVECIRQWVARPPSVTYCITTTGGGHTLPGDTIPVGFRDHITSSDYDDYVVADNNTSTELYHPSCILHLYINNDCPNCRTPVFPSMDLIINILQNCKLQFVADYESSNNVTANISPLNETDINTIGLTSDIIENSERNPIDRMNANVYNDDPSSMYHTSMISL